MDIYSDHSPDTAVDALLEQYDSDEKLGNERKISQCVLCAKLQATVEGAPRKERKALQCKILQRTGMKRNSFYKDAAIGRYVETRNDPDVYTMPKSKIQAMIDQQNRENQSQDDNQASADPPAPKETKTQKMQKHIDKLEQTNADYKKILAFVQSQMGDRWIGFLEKNELPAYSFA
mgnify:CR=1 FL=1